MPESLPITPYVPQYITVHLGPPGSSAENVRMREESGDGRGRFEGELFHDGIKYEFEIDPKTGIIFDWNADLRE